MTPGKSPLSTLPVPERLIVATIQNQTADTRTVHQPAEFRDAQYGTPRTESLTDRMARNNGIPPYEWPAACGVSGVVYVKAGPFEQAADCVACRQTARADRRSGLGRRQRQIMAEFDVAAQLPVGFLIRQLDTDGKIVDAALRSLKAAGLVRRVGYGIWERAA